jgi:hypothetical protein
VAKTLVPVAIVAVIAALAAADTLRGRPPAPAAETTGEEAPRGGARGPASPERGVLAGTLYVATLGGCLLQALDLVRLDVAVEGPATKCTFSVSPDGARAVVAVGPVRGSLGRSRAIWLADLEDGIRLVRPLGVARSGAASWSPEGAHLAWCRDDGRTTVLALRSDVRRIITGCTPVFAADGSVLTRPDEPLAPALLRDGTVVLNRDDLAAGLPPGPPGPLDVVGYAARPDGMIAVVVVQFRSGREPAPVIELWRDRRFVRAVALPPLGSPAGRGRFGERVEFSPDGREILVAFPGSGVRFMLMDAASGAILLGPTSQHGVGWSPDAAWFAVSTAEEIVFYPRGRAAPAYVLPVGASALAWR